MLYIEDYVLVNKGLKLSTNQDNIYINGIYLSLNNDGINNYKIKTNYLNKELVYAIFDGIGGLSKGEYASYFSSKILSNNKRLSNNEILNKINNEINKYNVDNNIKMGTTGSIVRIKNKKVLISQVGDSPVYILKDNKIEKLVEHNSSNNLLDNYLGTTNELKVFESKYKLKNNDKILICSDGLSSSVGINEIEYILKQSNDIKYITDKLMNCALKCGGNDNISILVLQVKRNYKEIIYILLFVIIVFVFIFLLHF